jgi:DNA-binding NtrC family response regulator
MTQVWIIHRDPPLRAALARLAGVGETAFLAAPGDPVLDEVAPADVVLVGLGEDFEVELQFAHRAAKRLAGARWILVADRRHVERARRLFDTVDSVVLAYPPEPRTLRDLVRNPPVRGARDRLPLSQRPARDRLGDRFARWFADLEFPDLLRVLDPQLVDVPLLIQGEPGTGRGLLARYIHTFGGSGSGALLRCVCSEAAAAEELLDAIAAQGRRLWTSAPSCTVWLEDVDRLPLATQRQVQGWVEYGLPAGALPTASLRWIGTATDDGDALDPQLRQTLGAFLIRVPAVRERPGLIAPFVADTALAWSAAHGGRPRRFGEDAIAVLEEYPWPGNLRELESATVQTLLVSSANPVRANDLHHEGFALAPLATEEMEAPASAEEELEVFAFEEEPLAAEPMAQADAELEPEPNEAIAPLQKLGGAEMQRLVGAVSHEVRNPLTTIRTFAELLPTRYGDADFRSQFSELVGRGVDRIEEVVTELSQLATLSAPANDAVDIANLLEELLDQQRELIHRRRLLVLKELDKARPLAFGDRDQLRAAFDGLLRKCLELVPERGDVYFASRHHDAGLRGMPSLRVLVRFNGSRGEAPSAGPLVAGVSQAENALEFVVAETVVRNQGGSLAVQAAEGDETILVLDLPAPP